MSDLTSVAAQPVLYGLQCGDPHHEGHGYQQVYVVSQSRHKLAGLHDRVACYELVRSTDGGQTWARADT